MLFQRKNPAVLRDADSKIARLQLQREETKTRIRSLREEMSRLVERAAEADDLDRSILSLDYESRRAMLQAETEHFQDTGRLISQLQGIRLASQRRSAFSGVAEITDSIDTEALQREEDAFNIRRDMMREDQENFAAALSARSEPMTPFAEDPEFAALVQARRQKLRADADSRVAAIAAEHAAAVMTEKTAGGEAAEAPAGSERAAC